MFFIDLICKGDYYSKKVKYSLQEHEGGNEKWTWDILLNRTCFKNAENIQFWFNTHQNMLILEGGVWIVYDGKTLKRCIYRIMLTYSKKQNCSDLSDVVIFCLFSENSNLGRTSSFVSKSIDLIYSQSKLQIRGKVEFVIFFFFCNNLFIISCLQFLPSF